MTIKTGLFAHSAAKNNALEGLRGLAALMVVLSHCVFTFYPYLQNCNPEFIKQQWETVAAQFPRTLYNGGFAVCIFFAMSGYVLSKSFFAGNNKSLEVAAVKRYIRLVLPVAASILICYAMMKAGMLKIETAELPGFITQAYQGEPNLSNALADGIWKSLIEGNQTYNYVLWTIRIEFLGSMLLFAYLALFGRSNFGWIYTLPVMYIILTLDPANAAFYALFFAGAYLNKAGERLRNPVTHTSAMIIGLFLGGVRPCTSAYDFMIGIEQNIGPMGYAPTAFGALLVVWVVVADNSVSRFFSFRPFVWLGAKSFSLYLLHTVVLSSVGVYVFTHLQSFNLFYRAGTATLAVLLVSVVVAIPFARFVDDNAVKLANKFGRFAFKSRHEADLGATTAS